MLHSLYPSPAAELNKLVALAKVDGVKKAFAQLIKLDEKQFAKNHLYFAIKADFEKQLNKSAYKKSLEKAIDLTNNQKEKEFLQSKI